VERPETLVAVEADGSLRQRIVAALEADRMPTVFNGATGAADIRVIALDLSQPVSLGRLQAILGGETCRIVAVSPGCRALALRRAVRAGADAVVPVARRAVDVELQLPAAEQRLVDLDVLREALEELHLPVLAAREPAIQMVVQLQLPARDGAGDRRADGPPVGEHRTCLLPAVARLVVHVLDQVDLRRLARRHAPTRRHHQRQPAHHHEDQERRDHPERRAAEPQVRQRVARHLLFDELLLLAALVAVSSKLVAQLCHVSP